MVLLTQRFPEDENGLVKTIYVTSLDELQDVLKSLETIQCSYAVRSRHNAKDEASLHYRRPRGDGEHDMYREPYRWWEIKVFREPSREAWPLGNNAEAYERERFGNAVL